MGILCRNRGGAFDQKLPEQMGNPCQHTALVQGAYMLMMMVTLEMDRQMMRHKKTINDPKGIMAFRKEHMQRIMDVAHQKILNKDIYNERPS